MSSTPGSTSAWTTIFRKRVSTRLRERSISRLFGEDGRLAGFEIWESEEAYRKFEEVLVPILAEVGIQGAQPQIVPIHRLAQSEAEVPWTWGG